MVDAEILMPYLVGTMDESLWDHPLGERYCRDHRRGGRYCCLSWRTVMNAKFVMLGLARCCSVMHTRAVGFGRAKVD